MQPDLQKSRQYFVGMVRAYEAQIGKPLADYLIDNYDIGEPDVAFTRFITALTERGYDEQQLMQGQFGQLAQMMGLSLADYNPVADPNAQDQGATQPTPYDPAPLPQEPLKPWWGDGPSPVETLLKERGITPTTGAPPKEWAEGDGAPSSANDSASMQPLAPGEQIHPLQPTEFHIQQPTPQPTTNQPAGESVIQPQPQQQPPDEEGVLHIH